MFSQFSSLMCRLQALLAMAVFICLFGTFSSTANARWEEEVIEARMLEHIRWLHENTPYNANFRLPRVRIVSQYVLNKIRFGNTIHGSRRLVEALYDMRNETIYMREDWNPESMEEQHILVHELVHHLQKMNKVPYECMKALERDAYLIENKWIMEHGFGKITHPIFIMVLSTCPPR